MDDAIPTVRCKIERKGGSVVTLDATSYHFKPRDESGVGPHLCEVDNEGHLARFLSITEGYELHRERTVSPDPIAKDPDPIATGAPIAGPVSNDVDTAVDKVLADPEGATDEQVAAAFEELNGRLPNPRAKRETIIERIKEAADVAK